MAEEYTPTTEQVRGGFAHDPEGEYRDPINYPANHRANLAAFDRWLAARDAETRRLARIETLREARNAFVNAGGYRGLAFGVMWADEHLRALAEKEADRA